MSLTRSLLLFAAPAFLLGALALPAADASPWGDRGGHGHRGDFSADDARDHADFMADRLIKKVDGTDAQRAAIDVVLDDTVPAMVDLKDDKRDLKQRARQSLSGGEIDRAELETIRGDTVALFDDASGLMLDAFVRVGEILTPEQRQEVVDHFDSRHR